ncbi:hypothetical protein RSO68_03470 [Halomonas saccharevitans]|uniref:Uncharacterized protein n=1 Tax=Halomonas saccharevitans TaxID=416872 RepID=A0ABU3NBF4_9GAMM|nr:hypothetical protein [Halomonas saccharevitans]MDT8878525.1 hypothetical protein [Halomonas saccharevitans]
MGMQFDLFGAPTKPVSFPAVGSSNARCLWLMLNEGWLDNDRLRAYGMGNASRRAKDLVENYGWPVVTRWKSFSRPDGVIVSIKEYRVEPVWLHELVRDDEVFAERLAMWGLAQNDYEHGKKGGEA